MVTSDSAPCSKSCPSSHAAGTARNLHLVANQERIKKLDHARVLDRVSTISDRRFSRRMKSKKLGRESLNRN